MMYVFVLIYSIFYVFIFFPLLGIAAIFNKKIRDGLIGRWKQSSKIQEFVTKNKHKKIIFFHSASVGEWEQSIPIIKELKQKNKDIAILASFFSPSGMNHAKKTDVDCAIYLPFDFMVTALIFFKKVKPAIWIISKYDIWPCFLLAAHIYKVPVILSSAELAEDSTRYKKGFATINRLFYKYIQYILPISEDYKNRFLHIFPFPERLIVVGDARYDQIIAKSEDILQQESISIFTNALPITFIAGSIWPADEKHLLPALISAYKKHANLQIILVPHELHESHLKAIEESFAQHNIQSERYSNFSKSETKTTNHRIAIIDTIGMLAKLYKTTNIAYIGGAFSTGVHNVAEPAVFGNAILFGPKHINSYEAVAIKQRKGGYSISNTNECYTHIESFIKDAELRNTTGKIAQDFILSSKGATQKITKIIEKYIP